MTRVSACSVPAFPAAIVAATLGLGIVLAVAAASPAAAYDDDVDVVCFDIIGGSEIECQTIGQLTAECEKADPEFTTDECQGLLQNRKPFGLTDRTKDRTRRDDNGGKGREPNGGNNGGGNNGGGGSGNGSGNGSGSGSANGANNGGSGPNG